MTALLASELRKLRATRSWWAAAATPVAFPVLITAAMAFAGADAPPDPSVGAIVRGSADVVIFATLILGILSVAGEHRHGTIVSSLLAAPRRLPFLAAKLASQASIGAVVAVLTTVASLGAAAAFLASHGAQLPLDPSDVAAAAGGLSIVALFYAVAGVALGAILRNQTAAIAGALLWLLAVERLLPMALGRPGLERWLPGGAAARLLHLGDAGPAAMGLGRASLVLFAVGAALVAAAAVTVVRDDVD